MRRDKSNDLFTDTQYLLTSVISLRPSEIQAKVLDHLSDTSTSCDCCRNPRVCFLAFHFWVVLLLSREKKWHCNIGEMLYTVYFSFSTCASHDFYISGHVSTFSPFHVYSFPSNFAVAFSLVLLPVHLLFIKLLNMINILFNQN